MHRRHWEVVHCVVSFNISSPAQSGERAPIQRASLWDMVRLLYDTHRQQAGNTGCVDPFEAVLAHGSLDLQLAKS